MSGRVWRLPGAAKAFGLVLGLGVLSLAIAAGASGHSAHVTKHVRAASGTPIHIMVTGTFSGTGAPFPQIATGGSAAADSINATGGINGHPLKVDLCDDQNSPALVQSCGEKAASNHDVAVVSGNDPSSNLLIPVLQKSGIPFVGNITNFTADATSPISFPGSPGAYNGGPGVALIAEKAGCKKAVTLTLIVAGATKELLNGAVTGLKAAHVPIAKEMETGESTSSFASYVAAAQAVGADCIAFILDEPQTTALMAQVKQTGNGIKLLTVAIDTAPLTTLDGVGDGVYLYSFSSPPQETNKPAPLVAAENAIIKYGKVGSVNAINPVGLTTFAGVLLAADGLRQVHGAYTAKTELTAMGALKNASTDDIWPPYTTAGVHIKIKGQTRVFNPDVLSVQIEGDTEVKIAGFKPIPGV